MTGANAYGSEYSTFTSEVQAFLSENLTDEIREAAARNVAVTTRPEISLQWQAVLHRKGWAAIHWPADYGGPGWDLMERFIFMNECCKAGAPELAPMSIRMAGPAIIGFGTSAQRNYYLPRILSGEDYWCQGFSEPGAGSDLASLAMRAERDGDAYVLNGSKIWTTHAHHANRIFLLVRTSTKGRPQQGITFLLCRMDTPGISVRPIKFFSDEHEVNEVFFNDVRIPITNRVGAENQGWSVAKYLLEFERGLDSPASVLEARLARLIKRASIDDRIGLNAALYMRTMRIEMDIAALRGMQSSLLATMKKGGQPGIEASVIQLAGADLQGRISEIGIEIAGINGQRPMEQQGTMAGLVESYFNGRAQLIAGGTQEIQRNIVAQRMLGFSR